MTAAISQMHFLCYFERYLYTLMHLKTFQQLMFKVFQRVTYNVFQTYKSDFILQSKIRK